MRPRGAEWPALSAQGRIARTRRAELEAEATPGLVVELTPGDALLMPSGWWHEVESLTGGDVATNAGYESLGSWCLSVGVNWPSISDAIPAFGRWRDTVRAYPVLPQGQVLREFYGAEKAERLPGFNDIAGQSVFAGVGFAEG
jgi:hypothetical protein